MDDPVNPLFAVAALAIALATVWLLGRGTSAPHAGRFVAIDGLRGYLAFCVFLHHSVIWYFYLRSKSWELPPSQLFVYFGQASVALFFMITSFLFFSKLLESGSSTDWTRLYLSRLLRITPLYLLVVALMALIVAVLSHFRMQEPLKQVAWSAAKWLTYTILGGPDLNGVRQTSVIVAQVTWSLTYEWLFYLALPLLALPIRVRVPVPWLVFSVLCMVFYGLHVQLALPHVLSFLGGIAAALAIRVPAFANALRRPSATFAAVACLIAVVLLPAASRIGISTLLLLAGVFVVIASGNSLFGILTARLSRQLGEMAYSIYLLHGLMLFVTFQFVIGRSRAATLSPTEHWAVVLCCAAFLILLCHFTYRMIELPPNRSVSRVNRWVQRTLGLPRHVPLPTTITVEERGSV